MTLPPTVTVAICTYNRVGSLGAALGSIRRQRFPASQVVVVNGPSTDGTATLLAAEPNITVLSVAAANLSASRNVAIRSATGDLVAFIDDDAVADPYWLASIVPAFSDRALGASGGPVLRANGVDVQAGSSAVDCFGRVEITAAMVRGIGRPGGWWTPYPTGTNAVFRREALVDIGGFDEVFTYFHDETDVCRRMVDAGWTVSTLPIGVVHHGMLPGVVRPVSGPPDRRPIVRSLTYFALRHGVPRRGMDATRCAIDVEFGIHLAAAVIDHPDDRDSIRLDLEQARRSGEAAVAGPPLTRDADFFRLSECDPVRPVDPADGGKHVVLVCRAFDVSPNNGIPQSYRLLARSLVLAGNVVRVVAASPTRQAAVQMDRDDHVIVHHVPVAESATPWTWSAQVVDAVDAIAKRWPVDLLIGPNWDSEALGVARTGAVDVVTTLHTSIRLIADMDPRLDSGATHIRDRIEDDRELMRRSKGFLAATDAALGQSDLPGVETSLGLRHSAVVPRGFPDTEIRRRGAPPNTPVVLVVGRCEARKGVTTLLRAWDQVRSALPGAELQIVGHGWDDLETWDPTAAATLRDLVASGSVVVLGPVPRQTLLERLAAASVVAVPSLYESFGLVAAEALRAGVPVVASDVGGLPAVVGADGVAGRLVAVEDAAALGCALVEVLVDGERNATMGRAARARFEEHFTEDRMTALLATAVHQWTQGCP